MKKLLRILFISFFLILSIRLSAQSFNVVLGRPTDSTITLSTLFDQNVVYTLQWGSISGQYTHYSNIYTATAGLPDVRNIEGLLPDTRYYYQIQYKIPGAATYQQSDEFSFHTQRSKGSTFTFTLEADEHLYDKKGIQNMYRVTLANEAADQPDFMMTLGDIFGDDHTPNSTTAADMDSLHKAYRPFLGSICHSIPFYICLGNHEGEKKYYLLKNAPENIAVYGTLARKKYYPNPYPNHFYSGNTTFENYGIGNPENYYAFTWGDALFVVLDAYRDDCDSTPKPHGWDWSLGLPQYNWLKNTLENSNATHKFVFAHHISGENRGGKLVAPLNEWGGHQTLGGQYTFNTYRPGWGKPIHQLFIDNHVNIFFQGHDHLYAHEVLDGVTYQEVPMAADSTYQIGMLANADAYTADTLDGTGHIRVRVSPDCIQVDFVRSYLPADTLDGIHKNREIGMRYTIGNCSGSGINAVNKQPSFTLYPNPASNHVKVSGVALTDFIQLKLFDMQGRLIHLSLDPYMDVQEIPNGIYIMEIETYKGRQVKRLIIEH